MKKKKVSTKIIVNKDMLYLSKIIDDNDEPFPYYPLR